MSLEQIENKISKIIRKVRVKIIDLAHNNSGAIQCIELPLNIIELKDHWREINSEHLHVHT